MPTWNCYGVVHATKYLGTVEADTPEEAERKALELDEASVSLCHRCADEVSDPEVADAHNAQFEDG